MSSSGFPEAGSREPVRRAVDPPYPDPYISSLASSQSLGTASLRSLIGRFPDAPTPGPFSGADLVPSMLVPVMEERVLRDIFELYGLRRPQDMDARHAPNDVFGTEEAFAAQGLDARPASPTSTLADSWVDVMDVNSNDRSSIGSGTTFGPFQTASPGLLTFEESNATTPESSESGEDAPLIRPRVRTITSFEGVHLSGVVWPSTPAIRLRPRSAANVPTALTAITYTRSHHSVAGESLIDNLSSCTSHSGEHRITTEDERVLDALGDSSLPATTAPSPAAGPLPCASTNLLRDPPQPMTASSLVIDKPVLNFSAYTGKSRATQELRIHNIGPDTLAFKLYHAAPPADGFQASVPDWQLYAQAIRITPRVGVLKARRNVVIKVYLELGRIPRDLTPVSKMAALELRSTPLSPAPARRWSADAIKALFVNRTKARRDVNKQLILIRLPTRNEPTPGTIIQERLTVPAPAGHEKTEEGFLTIDKYTLETMEDPIISYSAAPTRPAKLDSSAEKWIRRLSATISSLVGRLDGLQTAALDNPKPETTAVAPHAFDNGGRFGRLVMLSALGLLLIVGFVWLGRNGLLDFWPASGLQFDGVCVTLGCF